MAIGPGLILTAALTAAPAGENAPRTPLIAPKPAATGSVATRVEVAARAPLVAPKPAARTAVAEAAAVPPGTGDLDVPPGFRAVAFADDDLAHNLLCLTHDAAGRVVVSGPGFVKRLIDADGDGAADRAELFADGPETGCQGMFFLGNDLLCVGDGGLLRYRDADGDGVWDGLGKLRPDGKRVKPQKFLTVRTWGEHDVHALRRGPDGWWYLIAGNLSEVNPTVVTRPTSPVRGASRGTGPEQGVLARLTPDLTGGEVVADGMRNAYDFAFAPNGDAFTYDSDGERDVTLPWYRPTKVLTLVPGSNAGWLSRSFKRASDDPSMPPVVVELGRGSPTGVVCYRHTAFPEELRGALIVADWTFGRVLAVPLTADGAGYTSEPVTLMTGSGLAGFAPTSMSVGPDGDLWVCVGGRGTRGGVYRLTYDGDVGTPTVRERLPRDASGESRSLTVAVPSERDPLTRVLTAPQPLGSWSRAEWEPLARALGPAPLRAAALDQSRPAAQRVRAVEILTEKHGGLPANVLPFFAADLDADVRARAAWAHGVRAPAAPDVPALGPFLTDGSPRVRRVALEALMGMTDSAAALGAAPADRAAAVDALAANLAHPDRLVRAAAGRVVGRLANASLAPLAKAANARGPVGRVTFALGYLTARPRFDAAAVRLGLSVLESDVAPDVRRDAVRLIQVALGDVGPRAGVEAVFEGYSPGFDLAPHEAELNPAVPRLSRLLTRRRQGREEAAVDHELVRVAAMLAPYNPVILGELTARLTGESDPTDDLHHLIAAARLPVERSIPQTEAIAAALLRLDRKIADRGLNTDTNWEPRMAELYAALFARDPLLAPALVQNAELGRPAHVALLANVPADLIPKARARFAEAARAPDYDWTGDVVFLLGAAPGGQNLIRPLYENRAVRGAVVMSLANAPASEDRPLFVESLDSGDLSVVTAALGALAKLPASDGRSGGEHAAEQGALVALLRRLSDDDRGRGLKTRTVELLRRNTGRTAGFDGNDPATHAAAISEWTRYVAARFPAVRTSGGPAAALDRLDAIAWEAGDAARGAAVFKARACATCHGGRGAVGPDLAGAGERYGRKDRWTAILDPSRDVPGRYRTELIVTADGRTLEGLVVYQSVDGVTLRDGQGRTWRVEADDILERTTGSNSLMPTGLMDDATDREWADLEAYLRGL